MPCSLMENVEYYFLDLKSCKEINSFNKGITNTGAPKKVKAHILENKSLVFMILYPLDQKYSQHVLKMKIKYFFISSIS